MRIHQTKLRFALITLLLVLIAPICSVGSPEVHLTLGFDEQVMRHRFAPFLIQITGLSEPIDGALIVRQTRGIPGSRQASISHTIAEGILSNSSYEATLPLSEPLNPITVELVDVDGTVLAAHQYNARLGIREWPFPVIVGDPLHVDRTEAIIDASELPTDWWAYDAVDSVWLLTPIVSTPVLETLGEWVVSGGSLVLFTGADFPRMDSPVFRKLLPLSTPVLREESDGTYILEGNLKSRASSNLARNGTPILVKMPLGAGIISLITVRSEDLSEEEFEQIFEEIDSTMRMPNIEQLTLATLRSTGVPRPPYWITGVLVALILIVLFLFSETPHRLRSGRTFAVLGLVIVTATVWSGFFANRNNAFISLYRANTSIRVLSSFGLDIDLWTLYATQIADISLEHPEASYPLPAALPTTTNVDFSEENDTLHSTLTLQRNERRDLSLFNRGRLDVTMNLTSDGAEILNRTDGELHGAYVLLGEGTYFIPVVQMGTKTYALTPAYLPEETSALLRALQAWFPLRDGESAWLLLMEKDDQRTFEDEGTHKKVRQVAVSLIEGVSE